MNCPESRRWLSAEIDRELDAVHSLELSRHLQTCPACAAEQQALQAVRRALQNEALAYRAPAAVRQEIGRFVRELAAEEAGERSAAREPVLRARLGADFWTRLWRYSTLGAAALALLLVLLRPAGPSAHDQRVQELVASHIRSLQAEHLMDVASSDQHTVKPWFDGKVDFAPVVKDWAAENYPLIGGRLDYVGGRSVAALVYRHSKHYINVFVWPVQPTPAAGSESFQGYAIVTRAQGGLAYYFVSDLNAVELGAFADRFFQ